jgi:hypothetical protein
MSFSDLMKNIKDEKERKNSLKQVDSKNFQD